ncbi:MAG: M48 family metalloprotease [Saprospiraceae bacterium]
MKQICTLAFLLIAMTAFGQLKDQKRVIHSCSYGEDNIGAELCSYFQSQGFSSNTDAEESIRKILEPIGLKPNFVLVPCPNIQNALAVNLDDGVRYIVYDPIFMEGIQKNAKTNWTSISILAHEVGHHLNGHTLTVGNDAQTRGEELEADEFSGFILAKIGSSLEQAQAAMKALPHPTCANEVYSSHPCLEKRLKAIKEGWDRGAKTVATNNQTNTTNQENTTILPDILNQGTFWKATESGYWFKDHGTEIGKELISQIVENDVVAYHPKTGISYLLPNYKYSKDNQWRTANVMATNHKCTWKADGKYIWFVMKGNQMATKLVRETIGVDMLGYYPETNTTYLMPNYSGSLDNRYRTAVELQGSIAWKATREGYWLLHEGKNISLELTATYSGNDVIVYHAKSGKRFVMPNYANRIDGQWYSGSLVTY